MPSISEGKTCQTTNDSGQIESYYKKEFKWDNIHLDPMNSMESVFNNVICYFSTLHRMAEDIFYVKHKKL